MALIGAKSPVPITCAACGREAGPTGFMTGRDVRATLWLCKNCISYGARISHMKRSDLTNAERRAIEKGKAETAEAFLDSIITCLWAINIRSLEDLNPTKFAEAVDRLKSGQELQDQLEKFLVEYALFMRNYFEPPMPPEGEQ